MKNDPLLRDLLGESADILPVPASAAAPSTIGVMAAPVGGVISAGDVAYDGSDMVEKLANWQPAIRSADADMLPEKDLLDARARDTMRNDAYVASGATLHKDNIVGSRFLLNSKPATRELFGKDDDVWEEEFQAEVEMKFALYAESPQHWVDAARINSLTAFIRLAVGVHTACGEVLASAEWSRDITRPFRTMVQMIDTDRLSTPWDMYGDHRIRKGVERDRFGAPKAYHIQNSHLNDYQYAPNYLLTQKWKRVPARKPWGRPLMLHVYEQQRPDQTRGVASMVTALTEMRMTKRFRQTELERAVIASTYAATIESELPSTQLYGEMGQTDGTVNPTVDLSTGYMKAVAAYSGGSKNMTIAGARIPMFYPGTHLKIQNPGAASPTGDKFEQSLLRHIAAALGVSYEQLSKDFTQTNYSGFRGAMGETRKAMMSRKKLVADETANFIYRLWLEEAINGGIIEALKRRNIPAFYDGMNAEAYSKCEWIGSGESMIDPLKETRADVLAIASGLMTKEEAIARRSGSDWRTLAKQIARERTLDDSLGNDSIYRRQTVGKANPTTGGIAK